MSEEEIFVEPSAENGNIPVDAPSEQPIEPEIPAEETVETEQPTVPEPQVFELPDGRKVDGQTLAKEWKENFLPEFTRKSQLLSEKEKADKNIKANDSIDNPYASPDYIPKSYDEIISVAEQRALEKWEAKQQAVIEQQQAVETEVANQLTELKKADPNLNENALFLHANEYRTKYGISFPDLKTAYTHMKDVAELTKNVQQTTAKNIQRRSDSVSTTQGRATGSLPSPSTFSSARDYLRAIQGLVQ